MSLPASYTKSADAMKRSKSHYQWKMISFDVVSFDKTIRQIEALAKSEAEIDPESFYPPVKTHKGKSRDFPMVDGDLRESLIQYLRIRIEKASKLNQLTSSSNGLVFIYSRDGSPKDCALGGIERIRKIFS